MEMVFSEILISVTSFVVFFLLDILDAVMCVVFRFLDEFYEGTPSSCYCSGAQGVPDGDNGLSESLHGRKSFLRQMGLLNFPRTRGENASVLVERRGNRWSDCGCESCVSWMKDCNGSPLHVAVRRQDAGNGKVAIEKDGGFENVIFIHGFLLSSSIWKELVFPYLSEHSKNRYNLYAVDLLGFGRSSKPRDCLYTLNDHLDVIEESVINAFELKTFHLVANSMGCLIALALAARHPASVKSIYLVAPPYFSSLGEDDVVAQVLNTLAPRRIWPPMAFAGAVMSWYEHVGRGVCFFFCRNHRTWERILKLVMRVSELHFFITDTTRHTHHSAWHTMHNVICGGSKLTDKHLEMVKAAGVRIHVAHGLQDTVVPVECSLKMKLNFPEVELKTLDKFDHESIIAGRNLEFTRDLEHVWDSCC